MLTDLQPDHCEEICATCHGRIPDGEALAPDPGHERSWSMVFCSEECKAMQDVLRI